METTIYTAKQLQAMSDQYWLDMTGNLLSKISEDAVKAARQGQYRSYTVFDSGKINKRAQELITMTLTEVGYENILWFPTAIQYSW